MARAPSQVVVIGAGVGGLACAIDVALGGHRVVVLEGRARSGGKASQVTLDGRPIDAGPTVLTMPWVFEELFQAAGRSLADEVTLERAEVIARHAWTDGTVLDLYADRRRSEQAIGDVFGRAEALAYRTFCDEGRRMYELSEGPFLRSQRPTVGSIVKQFGLGGLSVLGRLDGHRTMGKALEQRFASKRLRQLFGRYATYVGSSPFEAPATLNLVAHVEAEGVHRVRGGVHSLVEALERLARSLGVEFRHEHPVERVVVERGRAVGAVASGAFHRGDAVVFNGDVAALGQGLLGPDTVVAAEASTRAPRSLSAVTWAMVARTHGFPLLHHTVFFADDGAEFDSLLRHERVPAEPTVYVCAQDRADTATAPEPERLLLVVNAPATGDRPERWDEPEKRRCTNATMALLRRTGLTIEALQVQQATPVDFQRRFPGTGGALYGPRSTGPLSILSRLGAASKLPGLYLAGGSVHPGPGIPMATLSGRLAASQICQDLASTAPSARAATTGTTSTG